MKLFRRRPRYTDADAAQVAFFFAQYCELMKHGNDVTDARMKQYVSDIIMQLGVPEEVTIEEEPIALPASDSRPIIIHRKG